MPTILVVDDNADNLYVMVQMLKLSGYTVLAAENGVRALQVIEQTLPDLIIMDLAMPELDGWTTTTYLKQQPEYAHIPVIAVTSHVTLDHQRSALEAGCQEYIFKPVDFDALLRTLRSYLPAEQALSGA